MRWTPRPTADATIQFVFGMATRSSERTGPQSSCMVPSVAQTWDATGCCGAAPTSGKATAATTATSPNPSAFTSRPLVEDLFGDGLHLQIRRALIDLADLRVPVELFHRIVAGVAIAAEQLHGER